MTDREQLILELKQLILRACDKELAPEDWTEDEPLFGPGARLALDSLDALQVSMALQKRHGLRLTDSKETRRILSSVGRLADHLLERRPS